VKLIKRYWFPAAVTVLLGISTFNLYTIFNKAGGNAGAARTPEGSGDRHSPGDAAPTGPGIARTFALVVAPKNAESRLDTDILTKALKARGAVQEAQFKVQSPATVKLTIVEPVKLSALKEWLANQGAMVVEHQSPLGGSLRLHVSGMT